MLKTYPYFIVAFLFLTSACGDNSRSDELDKREAAVAEREKQVTTITEEYNQLILMRDSLSQVQTAQLDSISGSASWTDSLVGEWESRLVCISTSCRGYVIGDQRTEQWKFMSDSSGFQLQIAGKTSDTKTYWAQASENRNDLTLKEQGAESGKPATVLSFAEIGGKQIRGQKRNTGADNCKLVFSILLTPRSK